LSEHQALTCQETNDSVL